MLTLAECPAWVLDCGSMSDIALKNADAYATRYHLELTAQLGFGVHGTVRVASDKVKGNKSAIKAHRFLDPYLREWAVYERLRRDAISEVLGFHVPQLIRTDDKLMVIEMTIVTPPFVLDFAGAYLDAVPEFSQEVWAQWENEKQEQFAERWQKVRSLIDAFEVMGIHLMDVTPRNIRFGRT